MILCPTQQCASALYLLFFIGCRLVVTFFMFLGFFVIINSIIIIETVIFDILSLLLSFAIVRSQDVATYSSFTYFTLLFFGRRLAVTIFFSILQTKDHSMYLIYHGCMTKNTDGSNRLIGPGKKCLVQTDECFWKDPRDIRSCMVKTRSCTRTEPTVSMKDYHTVSLYTSETMDQSMDAWYRTTEQLIVLLLFLVFIILFIINNGNILTDRTNERNILKENTMIYNFLLMKYIFYS